MRARASGLDTAQGGGRVWRALTAESAADAQVRAMRLLRCARHAETQTLQIQKPS